MGGAGQASGTWLDRSDRSCIIYVSQGPRSAKAVNDFV